MLAARRALRDPKAGLYAMVFLANMGWGVMAPVLPDIQAAFRISVSQVALANSAFGVARLVLDIPIGVLVNRVDQRLMRFSGTLVLAVGAAMCAMAPTFPVLVAGRAINGVGAAIIQVTNLIWVSQLSSEGRRGRDLGIYQAIFQAGASISPIAGGILAGWSSWRAAFWFSAGMALLGFLPMLSGRSDWVEHLRSAGQRHKHPTAPAGARDGRNRVRSALFVANLVTFVLFFSVGGFQNTVIPLYGGQVLRLSPEAIGLALGVSTILRFVMSLIGGELSDRFGRRAILVPGLFLMGVGTLMLNSASDLATYWLAILVLSVGRFGNNVPATVLADHAPPERWGFLMGLNRSIGDLGIVLGPIAVGLILENRGYGVTALVSAAIVWLCVVAVVFGIKEVRPARSAAIQATERLQDATRQQ